ncbi:patatin-like phospholipase family protein [Hymenobacter taeanensis]|uniref:Patatin-like phospholipase family protein n=1 Tax=Hymenobacter taeanensis TaxID=2735321 RepID=A0A6M6BLK7_9BACT|nr:MULTISPECIES: patatin-like phospholipase family protein [Hymenobacter]QJX48810.1 patatin-like phospholipase family protein [Hymenobacter taeanensis]UOQ81682.1 patatin-like phospholipase family protein [Hymenobacter sp. 5414T-23]
MLGLALSGGGARGIAHLGILAAIDELGLPVGRLAGVSSGAIAATFYAAGVPPREILRMFQAVNITRLTRIALSRYGLFKIDAVGTLFEEHLGVGCTFEQLRLPLTLVSTDLVEGVSVRFSSGLLIPPLLASSAVPILYKPVEFEGRQLVDGGLLNNLPVEALLEHQHPGLRIVGMHCNPPNPEAQFNNLRGVIERTLNLAIGSNTVLSKQHCDLLLEPPELRRFRTMSYRQASELFAIGYQYTMGRAADLENLLRSA